MSPCPSTVSDCDACLPEAQQPFPHEARAEHQVFKRLFEDLGKHFCVRADLELHPDELLVASRAHGFQADGIGVGHYLCLVGLLELAHTGHCVNCSIQLCNLFRVCQTWQAPPCFEGRKPTCAQSRNATVALVKSLDAIPINPAEFCLLLVW